MLVELSVVEQRYLAVREALDTGATITDVATRYGIDRRTVHRWLVRYATGGLGALADRSSKPDRCPHQIRPEMEARGQRSGMGTPHAALPNGAPNAKATWYAAMPAKPTAAATPALLAGAALDATLLAGAALDATLLAGAALDAMPLCGTAFSVLMVPMTRPPFPRGMIQPGTFAGAVPRSGGRRTLVG